MHDMMMPIGAKSSGAALATPATPSLRAPHARARVDGKVLTRDGSKMRVSGCTYGPFAANRDGEPFPDARRVADDFALMTAIGINAIRTYHVLPEWLLAL